MKKIVLSGVFMLLSLSAVATDQVQSYEGRADFDSRATEIQQREIRDLLREAGVGEQLQNQPGFESTINPSRETLDRLAEEERRLINQTQSLQNQPGFEEAMKTHGAANLPMRDLQREAEDRWYEFQNSQGALKQEAFL